MTEEQKQTAELQVSAEIKTAVVEAIKEEKASEIKTTQNTTTVKLPSNGLINPNIKEVTLRRMTTKEAKTLYISRDENYLTNLIMSCIIEPTNITTEDLHPNDIIYLLFILRYISSPISVEQEVRCTNPDCNKVFEAKVNIPELKVNYLEDPKSSYTITLPECQDKITFRILSEGQINNCRKICQRHAKAEGIDSGTDFDWYFFISRVAYMILEINGKEPDKFDDKVDYITNLSAYDFETFNQAYLEITNKFGLDRKFYTTCPKCKEDIEVEAYIAPDFFRLVPTTL